MISIRTKVKLITIVLSVTMIFNILVTYYLIQDEKTDAQIINIAGKQRMLTQKMIGELHRMQRNKADGKEEFLRAQGEFNRNFQRLREGDLSVDKSEQISAALQEVQTSWKAFDRLTFAYLDTNSDPLLEQIYIQGNKTLELVDKTVQAYEMYATNKRDFINQIQLVLGLFTLFVIIYMGFIALSIQTQLNKFVKHSSDISGREEEKHGSELELACAHIQYFLDDVENAIDSASEAVRQSEKAALNLQMAQANPQAQKHLDKSEDIVIEANEELYKTSILLKKLKAKLQDAANPSF
jgi:nitrate/nitrite-specific signal transduction histidine kinase